MSSDESQRAALASLLGHKLVGEHAVKTVLFQQAIANYQNTVLAAQQDVSNSITTFVHSREQAGFLQQAVSASQKSVDISMIQYKAGGVDFIRVLNAQQLLVEQQENLVLTRTNLANGLVSLNRALGGGWELRQGHEFVPNETIEQMKKRTYWGDVIKPDYDSKKDFWMFPRPATTMPAQSQQP